MARHISFLLLGLFLVLVSCSINDDPVDQIDQAALDQELIIEYLTENNIQAEEHESGLFYLITREGNGQHPGLDNEVTVTYKGYLLDGTVFDQTTGNQKLIINLNRLIPGWQIGIPLLEEGGAGTLFIPSRLGYGAQRAGDIPPNSVLIFEIELLEFK